MKIRNRINLIMFMGLFMSFILVRSLSVNAAQSVELSEADLTKGITYVYVEADGEEKPAALNFNGNSVIIQESANTTDETPLINVYIDKNRNGVIDSGETMAMVDGSADIRTDLPMYGLYQEKTNQPIVITINSGKIPQLYGMLQAESAVTGADAVSFVINGGTFNNTYYVAKESSITSDGGRATVLQIDSDSENKINYLYGLYDCDVEVKNATDAGVSLCVENGVIGNMYMLYDSDVCSDGKEAALLDIDISGGVFNYFEGARDSEINTGSRNNVAVDVDITGNPKGTGSFYLLDGGGYYSKGSGYVVTGSVNVDIDLDEKPEEGYSFSYLYIAYYYIVIDGDLNVRYNNLKTSSTYGVYYSVVNGDLTYICEETCDMIYSHYVSYYSEIAGDADVTVVGSTSDGYNYIYGFYGVIDQMQYMVGGDVNFRYIGGSIKSLYAVYGNGTSNKNSIIEGDVNISLESGYVNYAQLLYGVSVGGDANVSMTDINSEVEKTSSLSSCYSVYYSHIFGNVTLEAENCKFYSFYGCRESECEKDVSVRGEKIQVEYDCYGFNYVKAHGDMISILDDIYGRYIYGVYGCYFAEGDVTIDISDISKGSYVYGIYGGYEKINGNLNVSIKDCESGSSCYGITSAYALGNVNVTLDGIICPYVYGMNSANAKGEIVLDIKNIEGLSSLYPYQGQSGREGDDTIIVNLSNLSMKPGNNSFYITNYLYNNQAIETTVDPQYPLPEQAVISPGNGDGKGILTYGEDVYLGGKYTFEKDFKAKNIHLCYGNYWIPEGVTVEATENFYFSSADILLEGMLKGAFADDTNSEGKYTNIALYMNGGSTSQDLDTIDRVYYPYKLQYDSSECSVQNIANAACFTNVHCEGVQFAKAGTNFQYSVTPNKGYSVSRVRVQTDTSAEDIEEISGAYSYVMGKVPTTLVVECEGKGIHIYKTVSDPVAELNKQYTSQNPLYDLSTLYMQGDAVTGELTYEVDSTSDLPEGLILEGNLIYGTPTKAYESGKNVVIHVTGKNGINVAVNLNVIVTEGEGKQTTLSDRILVDKENKTIYLYGNSVVFEANDNKTQVYLDDDMDGNADVESPLYEGDLSNYLIYGAKDTEVNHEFRITMNGGTIGTLYGAENSRLCKKDDVLAIYINGGTVQNLYGLSESTTDGTYKLMIETAAKVSSVVAVSQNAECVGYCHKAGNTLNFYGHYVLKESVEASYVYQNEHLTIDEGVSLTVGSSLYRISDTYTIVKGSIEGDSFYDSYYSRAYLIVMEGGRISENCNTNYLYYPIGIEANMDEAEPKLLSGVTRLTIDGEEGQFIYSSSKITATISEVPGYSAAYTLDGESYTEIKGNLFSFVPERKETKIYVKYTATPIEIDKQYADPVAIAGKTYTLENPLYDLRSFVLSGDASEERGGEISYVVKEDSTFPTGLSCEGTKIIGTTQAVDETGVVKVLVTGRNGQKAEAEIVISVISENASEYDINSVISLDRNKINLNGVSVVILPDLSDSEKVSIYPDANHDGVADNDIALKINNSTSYDLNAYTIYGYKNAEDPYQGDLSITMKGGRLYAIYGVYEAVIKGDVVVSIEGGTVQYRACALTYSAEAQNATLKIIGGEHAFSDISLAGDSAIIHGNAYSVIGGDAKIGNSESSDMKWYALAGATVKGNFYLTLGGTVDNFISAGDDFYGAYNSKICGNVKVELEGIWEPNYTYMLYNTKVYGDFETVFKMGTINAPIYYTDKATIHGALRVTIPEEEVVWCNKTHYLLRNSSRAREIYMDVSESNRLSSYGIIDSTSRVTETIYFKNGNDISIGGTHIFDKDTELNIEDLTVLDNTTLIISEGAKLTIPESVTYLRFSSSVQVINNGVLNIKATATVNANGTWVNNGTLNLENDGSVNKNGTWENYGILNLKSQGTFTSKGTLINNGTLISKTASYLWIYDNLVNNSDMYADQLLIYTNAQAYNNGVLETGQTMAVEGMFTNNGTFISDAVTIYSGRRLVNKGVWEIRSTVSNSGSILNSGKIKQTCTTSSSNFYKLGAIYTTKKLDLYGSVGNYSSSYSSIYYACELDYPKKYIYDVSLSGSGIVKQTLDGEELLFALGGGAFNLWISKAPGETIEPEIIIYGKQEIAAAKQLDDSWMGVALYEPMTIKVVYSQEAMDKIPEIQLEKESDRIENTEEMTSLIVGKSYTAQDPLYDLRDVQIVNEDEVDEDKLVYALKRGSVLPEGLVLSDGKIYGNLKKACAQEQDIVFVISEQFCEPATFTLTLGAVEKAVPGWEKPSEFSIGLNKTLNDIELPKVENGTYRWKNPELTLGNQETIVEDAVLQFIPSDTENYDWETAAEKEGAMFENGVLSFEVSIVIGKVEPKVVVPSGIVGIYGQTLREIEIPNGSNDGMFVWNNPSDKVGEVADIEKKHLATYIPNDEDVYKEVVVSIGVRINKALPEYTAIEKEIVELECGNALSTIELPVREDGTYRWITDSSVVPKQDMRCQIGFIPKDLENYDWKKVEGWSVPWGCLIHKIEIRVNHPNITEKNWGYDDHVHWTICPREGCEGQFDMEVHSWDEEEVVTPSTESTNGLKKYTCKCGTTKTEEMPLLTHSDHKYATEWKHNSKTHWHKCEYGDCEAITEPEAHQWNEGEEVLAPTETSVGIMRYTCECGAAKNEPIPMLAHTTHTFNTQWGYDETSHWQICEYEGCEEISEAKEHTWDEEEIVTRPSEESEGVREYTCKCGATKTETIPVLPHSDHTYADEWKYNSQMHWQVCQYEGCEAITEPEEHVWDEGVVITPATEESEGAMKHVCECGATKTEVIPKLQHTTHVYEGNWKYDEEGHWQICGFEGCESKTEPQAHVWDDGEEVTPATEESKGVMKYTCECGATKTEEIPKLQHSSHVFEGEWNYDQNTHWKACSHLGCEVTSDPELHAWDEGTITVDPTETSDGEIAYVCECGATKTEVMPKTGHVQHVYKQTWSYDATYHWYECEKTECQATSEKQAHRYGDAVIVKTATKEQKGTRRYTCKDCGYSYDEQFVSEEEEDKSPNVGDEFEDAKTQMKYKVSVKDSEVELISCGNKNASVVKISNTVVFDGVTYKVTSIANGAFKNYKKLKKVVIGSGIKVIGDKAFYGCKKLATVTIGKNVQIIGKAAFQNCTSLKKTTIPSKVKKIGSKAFYGCKKLLNITIKTQKLNSKNVGSKAFTKVGSSNYKKLTVKVPKKKYKAYKSVLKKRGIHAKAKYKKG